MTEKEIEPSLPNALRSSTLERSVHCNHATFDVREYVWNTPTRDDWTFDSYFLDLPLTPRPDAAWAEYIDGHHNIRRDLGQLMFVVPGRTLCSGAGSGRQRSLNCTLSTDMIDGLLPKTPVWSETALAEGLNLHGAEVQWLLLRIYREMQQPGFATEVVIESMANLLAVALIRRFSLEQGDKRTACAGGLSPWRMRRIRERVHADQPAPNLSELAALCNMSIRHLTRAFKAETGQTIARFIGEVTIERARTLLASTRRPIGEIAEALGFSNSTSFAYAFRRSTGLRPSDISKGGCA